MWSTWSDWIFPSFVLLFVVLCLWHDSRFIRIKLFPPLVVDAADDQGRVSCRYFEFSVWRVFFALNNAEETLQTTFGSMLAWIERTSTEIMVPTSGVISSGSVTTCNMVDFQMMTVKWKSIGLFFFPFTPFKDKTRIAFVHSSGGFIQSQCLEIISAKIHATYFFI